MDHLIMFAMMGKSEQEALVAEWMRHSKMTLGKTAPCFVFPGLTTHKMCKHACAAAVGCGERPWQSISHFLEKGIHPQHGLTGKMSNRVLSTLDKLQLATFFQEMQQLGASRATLQV
jgi:hypothetical protein